MNPVNKIMLFCVVFIGLFFGIVFLCIPKTEEGQGGCDEVGMQKAPEPEGWLTVVVTKIDHNGAWAGENVCFNNTVKQYEIGDTVTIRIY